MPSCCKYSSLFVEKDLSGFSYDLLVEAMMKIITNIEQHDNRSKCLVTHILIHFLNDLFFFETQVLYIPRQYPLWKTVFGQFPLKNEFSQRFSIAV